MNLWVPGCLTKWSLPFRSSTFSDSEAFGRPLTPEPMRPGWRVWATNGVFTSVFFPCVFSGEQYSHHVSLIFRVIVLSTNALPIPKQMGITAGGGGSPVQSQNWEHYNFPPKDGGICQTLVLWLLSSGLSDLDWRVCEMNSQKYHRDWQELLRSFIHSPY